MAAGLALATPALSALLSACQSGSQTSTSSAKGGTVVYAMEISDLPPLDPGTALSQGSTLAQAIHRFFHERNFVWVNTPIITASDAEGAGALFRVSTLGHEPAS